MPTTEQRARRRPTRADFPRARITDSRGNVVRVEWKSRPAPVTSPERSAAILLFTGARREPAE